MTSHHFARRGNGGACHEHIRVYVCIYRGVSSIASRRHLLHVSCSGHAISPRFAWFQLPHHAHNLATSPGRHTAIKITLEELSSSLAWALHTSVSTRVALSPSNARRAMAMTYELFILNFILRLHEAVSPRPSGGCPTTRNAPWPAARQLSWVFSGDYLDIIALADPSTCCLDLVTFGTCAILFSFRRQMLSVLFFLHHLSETGFIFIIIFWIGIFFTFHQHLFY